MSHRRAKKARQAVRRAVDLHPAITIGARYYVDKQESSVRLDSMCERRLVQEFKGRLRNG